MRRKDEFTESPYTLKGLILKIFLILVIIIILIWLIPKFFLYKSTKKHEEVKEETVLVIKDETINNLESAGIKYFNEENVPKSINDKRKVTLKELQDKKLIGVLKESNNECDNKNSYVEITKNENDYTLKTNITCLKTNKSKTTYLSNYKYCGNSYLCLRDLQKEKELEEQERARNVQVPSTGIYDDEKSLTSFGPWKNTRVVSCNTTPITCNINDTNCLRETKIEVRKTLVNEGNTYSAEHTDLRLAVTKNESVCANYNYVVINNNIYRTKGNYEELFSLSNYSTNSWTYRGEYLTSNTPYYGANEYYKYVSTDDNLVHKYYSYKYNYQMDRVSSFTTGCTNLVSRSINYYTTYKKQEIINKSKYENVCYLSERTREYK